MTRVALYARYSSDNQREASIADQFRLCEEHAARESWRIVERYSDAAISGSSVLLRPEIQKLLADAQTGQSWTRRICALSMMSCGTQCKS